MADKRKANAADDRTQETDRQFLDNNNVKHLMKDVLGKLLANRPADPLAFIANYFESLEDQTNLVVKAHQQICLTHHSRPAFLRNLKAAYSLLSQHKVFRDFELFGGIIVKKNLRGVSGSIYTDLLVMLTKDIPPVVMNRLMKKIECSEFEAVTFETFKSGVFTCCVLLDYVKLTDKLFHALDIQKMGRVEKALSKVVLDQLDLALNQSNPGDPVSILQSGYSLGPVGLAEALEKAYKPNPRSPTCVTCEEFVCQACEPFLERFAILDFVDFT
ncbi:tubulin polyglutamylase complex subunit 1-like [Liolophura sinensis]|uniref:tubulin polyglutamylase complex subunit 1-like n=1 Tax=Liolophura sinensis TaxID=3198878 RepID=UPI00315988FB